MRSNYEIHAKKELESQNYLVDYKVRPRMVPRNYKVDLLGLFDLVAVRAGDPVRWISVKGHGSHSAHKRAIENFFLPEGNQKELWRFDRDLKDKRRLRIRKQIIQKEHIKLSDEGFGSQKDYDESQEL